ncbi:MAG: 7,8-didemethyl-8-hydroxy-5-deazariboflavin synthase CofG [Candidatus Tectomicrobia bacterium]|nr:7,8-didemethyl-8-hydroxy-5-deazariboflavin synthase CofG [Candidatus Tectomicrobia bacterium]
MILNITDENISRDWLESWIETFQSVDDPLAALTDELKGPVSRALEGEELSREEAYLLIKATSEELPSLCKAASIIRDGGRGRTISFSPKVFIPLTRLCRDFCGYCTFRQAPSEAERLYMSLEEVLEVARAGEKLGCTEALFTLGERPEQRYGEAKEWLRRHNYKTTLEYLHDACELVLKETSLLPHGNPGTMSHREMGHLREVNASMGIMLENISQRLTEKGGPHELAPSKWPRARIKTLGIAGDLRVPFTTGILIGIGETLEERVESLLAIRDLHQRYGHIQEVIIQNFRAKSNTPMSRQPEPTADDLLWTVAVARLILGRDFNLQVPPNLSARDYPLFLLAGINDWGGISPLTIDYVNPEAPWPQISELRRRTEALGFTLRPRLPVYPEYIVKRDDYLPLSLKEQIQSMADEAGYVKGGIERYASTS